MPEVGGNFYPEKNWVWCPAAVNHIIQETKTRLVTKSKSVKKLWLHFTYRFQDPHKKSINYFWYTHPCKVGTGEIHDILA